MRIVAFRLKPGADLKESIEKQVKEKDIQAGFIVSCVGGLKQACIRMAGAKPDKQDIRTMTDDYEIVSLVGTVSTNGCHLHISFSDKNGQVDGGHLKEGSVINLTAEVVIGIDETIIFKRAMDQETGFKELVVER